MARETVLSTRWWRLSRDRYQLPGGEEGSYTYIDIPGSTMIVPRLPDGRLVLVRQFRYLMQRESLEFPAGGLQEGVDPLENARRELREETGFAAATWRKLGEFAPYNGVSNEFCQVYLAEDLTAGEAAPEPTEEFEVLTLTPEEVAAAVRSGEIWDGMTVVSLSIFEKRGERE